MRGRPCEGLCGVEHGARRLVSACVAGIPPRALPHRSRLRLWRCYLNPFNLALSALTALSAFSAEAGPTAVIGILVALSTGTRFPQEG